MRSRTFVALGLAGAAALGALVLAGDRPPAPRPPAGGDGADGEATWADTAAPRSVELARVRRSYDLATLDTFVAEQRARCARPEAAATDWRVLAEALLERCLTRDAGAGMRVGTPVHSRLPAATAADLEAAEQALERAAALGDTSSEHGRILAGVLSYSITGALSLVAVQRRIDAALERAAATAPDDPRLHVTFGCQKLFAPAYLGHDPAGALPHFEFAARRIRIDERPALFAAMACHLLGRPEARDGWLAEAAARNPANRFVAAVRQRLAAGDDAPFARDLGDDER